MLTRIFDMHSEEKMKLGVNGMWLTTLWSECVHLFYGHQKSTHKLSLATPESLKIFQTM